MSATVQRLRDGFAGLRDTPGRAVSLSFLARVAGAGCLNTVFGYLAFLALIKLGATAAIALLVSTLAGVLFNFQTSRRIVFQSRKRGLLLRFVLVYCFVFAVNYAAIVLLARFGLGSAVAQTILILPMVVLAFGSQSFFVFRTHQNRINDAILEPG